MININIFNNYFGRCKVKPDRTRTKDITRSFRKKVAWHFERIYLLLYISIPNNFLWPPLTNKLGECEN